VGVSLAFPIYLVTRERFLDRRASGAEFKVTR
jgi:hypothetical protein